MSQTTITLLFLAFAVISFILEKIPLGLTASICAIGLTLTGVLDAQTTFAQYVNLSLIHIFYHCCNSIKIRPVCKIKFLQDFSAFNLFFQNCFI